LLCARVGRGQGPEREGGTDALSPPRTNFRDSETSELTRPPRPAPLLRRQLIVDDSGQGAPPRCLKSSSAPIPAAGRINTRRYKHPSCGRLTLSGWDNALINGHLAYMLRPAAVLRSGHSLSRPPLIPLRGPANRLFQPGRLAWSGGPDSTQEGVEAFAEARALVCTLGLKSAAEW
jgi:hypothetical protein